MGRREELLYSAIARFYMWMEPIEEGTPGKKGATTDKEKSSNRRLVMVKLVHL